MTAADDDDVPAAAADAVVTAVLDSTACATAAAAADGDGGGGRKGRRTMIAATERVSKSSVMVAAAAAVGQEWMRNEWNPIWILCSKTRMWQRKKKENDASLLRSLIEDSHSHPRYQSERAKERREAGKKQPPSLLSPSFFLFPTHP